MVIVDEGLTEIASIVATNLDEIGIGDDGTAASSGDQYFGGGSNEVDRATGVSFTNSSNVVSGSHTFSFTSSATVQEASADFSGGPMCARQAFSAINVSDGDNLTVEWEITNNDA